MASVPPRLVACEVVQFTWEPLAVLGNESSYYWSCTCTIWVDRLFLLMKELDQGMEEKAKRPDVPSTPKGRLEKQLSGSTGPLSAGGLTMNQVRL